MMKYSVTVFNLRTLILAGLFYYGAAQAERVHVDTFIGEWQVKHVYIDSQRASRSAIPFDDPLLVGRVMSLTPEKITGRYLSEPGCEQPVLIAQSTTTLNHLLALTLGDDTRINLARDYLLETQGDNNVVPFLIECSSGMVGPAGENIANWLTMMDKQTLLTNWQGNTLLLLQKLSPGVAEKPSFSCQKAGNITEKTICKFPTLAAWDRSVAAAYEIVVFQTKQTGIEVTGSLAALKNEQRLWIAERNRCRDDRACIETKMVARVKSLMEKAN
ncbi:lysozyme inhibitor LprI family protein [Intestinirhabdus alba]|uniref:DUF1311 domain-containing protein n=1 Tax=Intestinirhabdus alba TaxID=2899544 RepID=A0A6L6IIU4_9ENTR|nr:hypothetical protein [Intestinirhabdus alba]MTH46055.1 hypothetical protein [Intestinirhabdus alba]